MARTAALGVGRRLHAGPGHDGGRRLLDGRRRGGDAPGCRLPFDRAHVTRTIRGDIVGHGDGGRGPLGRRRRRASRGGTPGQPPHERHHAEHAAHGGGAAREAHDEGCPRRGKGLADHVLKRKGRRGRRQRQRERPAYPRKDGRIPTHSHALPLLPETEDETSFKPRVPTNEREVEGGVYGLGFVSSSCYRDDAHMRFQATIPIRQRGAQGVSTHRLGPPPPLAEFAPWEVPQARRPSRQTRRTKTGARPGRLGRAPARTAGGGCRDLGHVAGLVCLLGALD